MDSIVKNLLTPTGYDLYLQARALAEQVVVNFDFVLLAITIAALYGLAVVLVDLAKHWKREFALYAPLPYTKDPINWGVHGRIEF